MRVAAFGGMPGAVATRFRLRAGAAAVFLACAPVPCRADCFDWADPGAVIEHGTLRGLPTGPLHWRIGRTAASGAHMATAVEVRWTGPDGRGWTQTLFEQMQDGRAAIAARRGSLELSITHCEPDRDCRSVMLPYAWDRATGQFTGTQPASREAIAAACEPAPRQSMRASPPPRGAP